MTILIRPSKSNAGSVIIPEFLCSQPHLLAGIWRASKERQKITQCSLSVVCSCTFRDNMATARVGDDGETTELENPPACLKLLVRQKFLSWWLFAGEETEAAVVRKVPLCQTSDSFCFCV